MIEFIRTITGKRFFDGQLPALIGSLERIANALEKQNEKEQICEWEFEVEGIDSCWKPGCKSYSMGAYEIVGFNVCPYCGKKIKVK